VIFTANVSSFFIY